MSKVTEQIEELKTQLDKLNVKLTKERSNRTIKCSCCNKLHKIKNLIGIQTYWYVQPRGCTDGGYWTSGEFRFVCPETDISNRILFHSCNYGDIKTNPQIQFKHIYSDLFLDTITDHGDDARDTINNYYVNDNLSKFELI
jgi:hypothetical protein